MKLTFNRRFKSVASFDSVELPSLTILTGVNGAGKSHLLEAIESGAILVEGIPQNQLNGPHPIRRFDSNSLVPQDTGPFSSAQISQEQTNFWAELTQHRGQQLVGFNEMVRQFGVPALESLEMKDLLVLDVERLIGLGLNSERANQIKSNIDQSLLNIEQVVTNNFIRGDPQNRPKLIASICSASKIPVVAMEQDDFFRVFPKLWQPVDLFQQSFARLFSAYQRQWAQNKLKSVAFSEGEKDVQFLDDKEFLEKHGVAPWDFLNEILSVAELDFRISQPYKWDDRPYEPILTDIKRNIRVKFSDLSSGEKILMSFALCLYHASDLNSAADFPKLLLFDEIDAPLHPSMTRSLLRTIEHTLVTRLRICVILTTHSPSTVALAPEDSIFVMHKQGANRLRQTSKDAALGILTSGVPTLSVNYENRRQVFVESKYDVQYYSALAALAKPWLDPEISLAFIATGPGGNGDCEQVKSVVNQLTNGGNRTVVGVIDWDERNSSSGGIFVLGEQERYSIENFVLDPVLIGLLILREKFHTPEAIGLDRNLKYFAANDFSQAQMQLIANAIVAKLKRPSSTGETAETVEYRYQNDFSVVVPNWLSKIQGHQLENLLKEAFPPLLRYRNEPDLKLAVIQRVLDEVPQFMPKSLVVLFKNIQKICMT